MAITSCTQEVYDAFLGDRIDRGFFHGHTYSANPTSCTAALAGIELLQSAEIQESIVRITKSHQAFDKRIRKHEKILETRQLGVIYALDLNVRMDRYGKFRNKLFHFFMKNGVCLRPLGNTIYILAPFVITDKQLQKIYKTIEQALSIF